MQRPTVLLALGEDPGAYFTALTAAGFDVTFELAPDARPDLAVLDCDLPADVAAGVYAELHTGTPVPTLLLFGDEIPEFATSGGSSGSDEYAIKPTPRDALVYRLQALLIRGGLHMPGEDGGWTAATAEDSSTIGEGHVISVFAPKGGVGKTTIAVNLAVALREQTRSRVLLFDA
ncbi:MAG TPA: AAA family ATPase, partial [Candidatus Limnocylindrales bacterium]|nr:AAA family ATPase [Candidatus Limnocylindrales bacterium]